MKYVKMSNFLCSKVFNFQYTLIIMILNEKHNSCTLYHSPRSSFTIIHRNFFYQNDGEFQVLNVNLSKHVGTKKLYYNNIFD